MNILTLSPIIIIALAIIFFLITKKLLKAIGFLLLLSLVVFFLSSILIYRDVQDFQNNFPYEEKLFLLEKDSNYVAGFVMAEFGDNDNTVILDNTYINEIRTMKKSEILGDNYKLLIFNQSAFEEVNSIDFGNTPLTRQEALDLINSENTMQDSALILIGSSATGEQLQTQLSQQGIDDESELRAVLFASLIGAATEEDSAFMINKIRSKEVEVYPQTVLFSVIHFIPDSIFNIAQKVQQTKEVIE